MFAGRPERLSLRPIGSLTRERLGGRGLVASSEAGWGSERLLMTLSILLLMPFGTSLQADATIEAISLSERP